MVKSWNDFWMETLRLYPLALISLFGVYKAYQEWLKSDIEKTTIKARESSAGEAKIKTIEADRDDYKKRFHAVEQKIEIMQRQIEKNQDHIQDISKEIRDNFQQSINILMRGK